MSIENQITLDVYEKLANVYLNNTIKHNMLDLEKAKLEIEELKKFLKNSFSSLPKNSKILEIGSANEEKSKYLQELGYKVTPSDIATDFLKAIKLNGLEPIKFNVLEDNFLDKYYGILCWKVFVHFTKEDALKVILKTYDALEKSGIFVFNAMNRENKNVESEWLDFAYEYRIGIERYFNYYYQEELDKLITQSKYEIIDFHKEGGDDNKKWLVYVLRKQEYMINKELKEYIENNIFPEYNKNEIGHGINHIKYVIDRSMELVKENNLDVNLDMVYVIASYHDIGHHIDSKKHEIISADIMSKDKNLEKFFTKEELIIIKEAIEDHRASSNHNPRTIYGKIVSSADRNNTIEDCLERTYTYGKRLNPNLTDEELYERAYNVLVNKFGINGYAKFYFKDKKYEDFLIKIRKLLEDKENYIKIQREYIKKNNIK